jgi:hypothetical protein
MRVMSYTISKLQTSAVMIAITFVSYFISSFQRPIKPPMKLETAKRIPKLREERKK